MQFHCYFTLPLFFLLLASSYRNPLTFSKKGILGTLTLVGLAFFYTTPWDSYLIKNEIWTYSPGNVLFTIYRIPIEEYFFFFIQTLIGCLLTAQLICLKKKSHLYGLNMGPKNVGLFMGLIGALALLAWIAPHEEEWTYLKLVFFWATPVIFLQWAIGWRILVKEITILLGALVPLCLYFFAADSFAIYKEIWTFPNGTISGIELFGILPIEEAL
ncbi:MAG: lycopene cyclase domain-containing protein, partial [Pseudomonadota bacterium]